MEYLFKEAQCGGPLRRAPLQGTLEDMLRKALDMGPVMYEGNLESGGVARIQGILNDE